jgi:hypothetical protein
VRFSQPAPPQLACNSSSASFILLTASTRSNSARSTWPGVGGSSRDETLDLSAPGCSAGQPSQRGGPAAAPPHLGHSRLQLQLGAHLALARRRKVPHHCGLAARPGVKGANSRRFADGMQGASARLPWRSQTLPIVPVPAPAAPPHATRCPPGAPRQPAPSRATPGPWPPMGVASDGCRSGERCPIAERSQGTPALRAGPTQGLPRTCQRRARISSSSPWRSAMRSCRLRRRATSTSFSLATRSFSAAIACSRNQRRQLPHVTPAGGSHALHSSTATTADTTLGLTRPRPAPQPAAPGAPAPARPAAGCTPQCASPPPPRAEPAAACGRSAPRWQRPPPA